MSQRNAATTDLKRILDLLDLFPPFLIRVMCVRTTRRRRYRLIPLRELSEATGIKPRTLSYIFAQESWAKIRVEHASKLFAIARVDVRRPSSCRDFFRQSLRRAYFLTARQQKVFLAKAREWAKRDAIGYERSQMRPVQLGEQPVPAPQAEQNNPPPAEPTTPAQ